MVNQEYGGYNENRQDEYTEDRRNQQVRFSYILHLL